MLFSISNSSMYHSSVSVYQCIPWPVDSVEIRYNPKCCLRLEPVSKLLYKLAWVAVWNDRLFPFWWHLRGIHACINILKWQNFQSFLILSRKVSINNVLKKASCMNSNVYFLICLLWKGLYSSIYRVSTKIFL